VFNFSDKEITDKYVGDDPLGFKHDALMKSVKSGSLDLTDSIDSFTRDRWKKDLDKNGRIDPVGEAMANDFFGGESRRKRQEKNSALFAGATAGALFATSRSSPEPLPDTNSTIDTLNNFDNSCDYMEPELEPIPQHEYYSEDYIKEIDSHQLFPISLPRSLKSFFVRDEHDDLNY